MRVPVFAGEGRLVYEERLVPRPLAPDDVVLSVRACGICGTDLNILATPPAHKARPGIVLGHEAVGAVVETGPAVRRVQAGDRVVIAPRLTCGQCRYCRRGLDNQCEDYQTIGTSLDGAFAPYLRAPERALYQIGPNVADDDAVFFEPLSCVVGALARMPVQPGDRVAIIGAGPMGALFALVCQAMGAGLVIMADVSPCRLDQARSSGADVAINPAETPLKDAVLQHTGIGCDLVIDAVGNQIDQAISLARRGGRVILFGLRAHDRPTVHQYTITRNDLTLAGAFVGLNPFAQTIQLLASGKVHPARVITHRLGLESLLHGVDLMRSGQAVKVVIEMSERAWTPSNPA
jgi:threonine dehydrogenase-like Zn-dependent dehydrogenase